jgi:hypothetical protein
VLPPHLPELISPEEHNQIMYTRNEHQTHRTLAALETVARWSWSVNQQPYVQLRDLLDTMSSDGAMTNQATWPHVLSALSIILTFVVLTSKYWQQPVILVIRRIFPCFPEQRPCTSQGRSCHATPRSPITNSATADCPCCLKIPDRE